MPSLVFAETHEVPFPLWTTAFFAALILSIAIMPLVNSEWWGKNYRYVSLGLAIPAIWIVGSHDITLIRHILVEYVSFIILLGSLFVIASGIVIRTAVRGGSGLECHYSCCRGDLCEPHRHHRVEHGIDTSSYQGEQMA